MARHFLYLHLSYRKVFTYVNKCLIFLFCFSCFGSYAQKCSFIFKNEEGKVVLGTKLIVKNSQTTSFIFPDKEGKYTINNVSKLRNFNFTLSFKEQSYFLEYDPDIYKSITDKKPYLMYLSDISIDDFCLAKPTSIYYLKYKGNGLNYKKN